jgi:hypothetical protein
VRPREALERAAGFRVRGFRIGRRRFAPNDPGAMDVLAEGALLATPAFGRSVGAMPANGGEGGRTSAVTTAARSGSSGSFLGPCWGVRSRSPGGPFHATSPMPPLIRPQSSSHEYRLHFERKWSSFFRLVSVERSVLRRSKHLSGALHASFETGLHRGRLSLSIGWEIFVVIGLFVESAACLTLGSLMT